MSPKTLVAICGRFDLIRLL